jgi:hypothetical protein
MCEWLGVPKINGEVRREKYGLSFPIKWSAFDIELYAFRVGRTVEQGGLGQAEHFWNAVSYCWGAKNPVGNTTKYFLRNPWSEEIVDELCRQTYVAVGGAAGSTKSETCAMWLIVKYLANARKTLGVVLSTSLKLARKRIWGSIEDFVRAVPTGLLPLKIISSMGIIRYESATFKAGDRACLSLIAAEQKQEKEAIGKLIGMHQYEVIVIADELSELPESILEYALPGGNLSTNPKYQFAGLSNPVSYFDSFGKLWEPKNGWTSVTVEDTRWETKYGVGLHFDALKSPNIPNILYTTPDGVPYLPTADKVNAAMESEGGPNSLRFWRMQRGFMCPAGEEDRIYTEIDIIKYKGNEPAKWGDRPTVRAAALDPAFVNNGDRIQAYFGTLGWDVIGQRVLQFDEAVEFFIDVTIKDEEPSYQIARQFKEACEARDIPPRNAAADSTGGGGPFCDILATVWSPEILRVNFGGKASDFPVSLSDNTPGVDRYYNRVTEIWYSGKELLRQGQLKGISPALVTEMTVRMYGTTGAKKLIYAEPKADMKLRTGKSPDLADAAFILVTLCRERFGFTHVPAPGGEKRHRTWREIAAAKRARLSRPSNLGTRRIPARPSFGYRG